MWASRVGGPVIPNKLFFFGAIDPSFETRTLIAPDDPDNFPLRELGEVDRDRDILNYAAKGSWQLNGRNRIDVSVFGDPGTGDAGPQRPIALLNQDTSKFSEISEFGGHNQSVRWNGIITPSWFVEASFSRAQNDFVEAPAADVWSFVDNAVPVNQPQAISGGIGFFEDFDNENLQYQVKSTYLFHGGGEHQIKGGFIFEDISFDTVTERSGPPITLADGQQTITGAQVNIIPDPTFGQIFRVVRANLSNVNDTTQDYLSLFVQDQWRVGNRLTVIGGLRWDRQKLEGLFEDFTWDENFAPRIGGTVDLLGDGRVKVSGNFGRYYAKIPNDIAVRSLGADAGVTRADYFDAALTQPIPDGIEAGNQTVHLQFAGLEPAQFDPDMNGASFDEGVVGVEYEALPGLNLGVRYIGRRLNDVVEDIGFSPLSAFLLGSASVEFLVTNPSADSPVDPGLDASHVDPVRDYDAVEVTADKRFGDNWRLQTSYRWGKLEGNYEGFFRNDNGQSDPGITSLFDFPPIDPAFLTLAEDAGISVRGNPRFLGEVGPLPNDRRHQFKAFGSYVFPFGLNLGGGVIASSGVPLTPLASNPVFGNDSEIPEVPRGSGFQTVDGFKERTETAYTIDFHTDYAFRLPTGQRITAILDIFNLFDIDRVIAYDPRTELGPGEPGLENPDFGAAGSDGNQTLAAIQEPFQARIGVRFEF